METATAYLDRNHYETKIKARHLELTSDESIEAGGSNKGFAPKELLCASLAACTSITLRMYADRKAWPLESLNVEVTLEPNDAEKKSVLNRRIELTGNLTSEQTERLLQIANLCPVHKVLSGSMEINTTISQ